MHPLLVSSDKLNATHQFKEGQRYDGESYTATVPRRPGIEALPNNSRQAIDRLRSKFKFLDGQPDR